MLNAQVPGGIIFVAFCVIVIVIIPELVRKFCGINGQKYCPGQVTCSKISSNGKSGHPDRRGSFQSFHSTIGICNPTVLQTQEADKIHKITDYDDYSLTYEAEESK